MLFRSNNPYGQYLMGLEEKEKREAIAVQSNLNEALSAQGFLGVRKCEPQHMFDPDTEEDHVVGERCFLQTPGKAVEAQLEAVFGADGHRSAADHRCFLGLAAGEETNPLPIRRKEGGRCPIRPGEFCRGQGIERAKIQPLVGGIDHF